MPKIVHPVTGEQVASLDDLRALYRGALEHSDILLAYCLRSQATTRPAMEAIHEAGAEHLRSIAHVVKSS